MVFKKENRSRRIFAVMKSVVRFVLFIKFLYTVYAACHILKQEIRKRDGCHGFDDNNRAGNDHRIVAAMDDKFCVFPDVVYRCCICAIDGVGLTAIRKINSDPSLIPPSTPPE